MRTVDSSVVAEVTAEQLAPILLVELQFRSGTARFWSGVGELLWGSGAAIGAFSDSTLFSDGTGFSDSGGAVTRWHGTGTLGAVAAIEETAELRAVGVELLLSGL